MAQWLTPLPFPSLLFTPAHPLLHSPLTFSPPRRLGYPAPNPRSAVKKTLAADHHTAATDMENSPAWQRVIDDLAGDDKAMRADLTEIGKWFPSCVMLRHHACGLLKVMTDDELDRACPDHNGIHYALVLRFAMQETRSDDPGQRARWWMYRSATAPRQPDPLHVGSRTERIHNVDLAVPAPVNTAYWGHYQPDLLEHDDVSDYISSDSEYDSGSDDDSGYAADSSWSTGWEEPEVIVLSDDEPEVNVVAPVVPEPEVHMVAPVAREGDKHHPIDVELLPDVPDIVKQEVEVVLALQAQVDVVAQPERKKKRKVAADMEVRRSERLQKLKN